MFGSYSVWATVSTTLASIITGLHVCIHRILAKIMALTDCNIYTCRICQLFLLSGSVHGGQLNVPTYVYPRLVVVILSM